MFGRAMTFIVAIMVLVPLGLGIAIYRLRLWLLASKNWKKLFASCRRGWLRVSRFPTAWD